VREQIGRQDVEARREPVLGQLPKAPAVSVIPWRQTTGGASSAPHSWTCSIETILRAVVLLALELVRKVVDLESARVVVRIDVALSVAEAAGRSSCRRAAPSAA